METNIFEEMYKGTPPWDIRRPQDEIVKLDELGQIGLSVLDVGCGTGENVLYLADHGHNAWGIDIVPGAIAKAAAKARERGLPATFLVWNALKLDGLGRKFDTIIDSGFFHTLSDEERPLFVRSLASALQPGGNYLMLCFSDREPGTWGPRRITQEEIVGTFGAGWRINYIHESKFDTNLGPDCCTAWVASVTMLAPEDGQSDFPEGGILM